MSDDAELNALIAVLNAKRADLGDVAVDQAIAVLRRQADPGDTAGVADSVRLRQVSILFCDIVDSTAILQALDTEDALGVVGDTLRRLGGVIEATGGRVLRYTGDGLKAAFGVEHTREDDAQRAVEAGLKLLEAARVHAKELQLKLGLAHFAVRVGINTGVAVLGGGVEAANSAMGHAVHVAARLEQAAPPGQLLIGAHTWALVRGRFEVQRRPPLKAKGVDAPLESFIVLRAKQRGFQVAGRGIEGVVTRMIGRGAELRVLQEAFAQTAAPAAGLRRVLVTADAGVGKSRLLHEFAHWAEASGQPHRLLRARATPQTPGQPYGLLRELLGSYLGILDDDIMDESRRKLENALLPLLGDDPGKQGDQAEAQVHLLGRLIGLDYGASPYLKGLDARQVRDGGFAAAADALRRIAVPGAPLLLFLDDLHWADDGSLQFLQHLTQVESVMPLLMLALARPALLERQGDSVGIWADGVLRLHLQPLDASNSASLADELLQRLPENAALAALMTERAEGNPFFMEELVKMLIDQGAIDTTAEHWQVNTEKMQSWRVPPTLTGVLQARLDGLPAPERHALQLASVIGQYFWDAALAYIEPQADKHLARLQRRELVHVQEAAQEAVNPSAEGVHEYAFRHQILHQVTYDTVVKAVKRHAHARTAEWLKQQATARSKSLLASAAEHYEHAGDLANAVELYAQAGDHMQRTFANDAAIKVTTRALRLLTDEMPEALSLRWRLLSTRNRVYRLLGRHQEQLDDVQALLELAERLPDGDVRRAVAAWYRADLASRTGDPSTQERESRRAIALADFAGAERLSLRALTRLSDALRQQDRVDEAELLGTAGLERTRALGDPLLTAGLLTVLGGIAEAKGNDVACLERNLESARLFREIGHRRGLAMTTGNIGWGYQKLGAWGLARQFLLDALEQSRAIGGRASEGNVLICLSSVAWREGDGEQALRYARASIEILSAVRSRMHLAEAEVVLGQAELRLGRLEDAVATFKRAETIARALGHRPVLLDALSHQAQGASMRNDSEQALLLAERVLAEADAGSGDNPDERVSRFAGSMQHLNRLILHRIWSAAGDPRAEPMLAEAHAMLVAAADRITDPVLREGFLTNLAENREIVELWATRS